jgi:hypothetical protein
MPDGAAVGTSPGRRPCTRSQTWRRSGLPLPRSASCRLTSAGLGAPPAPASSPARAMSAQGAQLEGHRSFRRRRGEDGLDREGGAAAPASRTHSRLRECPRSDADPPDGATQQPADAPPASPLPLPTSRSHSLRSASKRSRRATNRVAQFAAASTKTSAQAKLPRDGP